MVLFQPNSVKILFYWLSYNMKSVELHADPMQKGKLMLLVVTIIFFRVSPPPLVNIMVCLSQYVSFMPQHFNRQSII